jgi:hypothetical protein
MLHHSPFYLQRRSRPAGHPRVIRDWASLWSSLAGRLRRSSCAQLVHCRPTLTGHSTPSSMGVGERYKLSPRTKKHKSARPDLLSCSRFRARCRRSEVEILCTRISWCAQDCDIANSSTPLMSVPGRRLAHTADRCIARTTILSQRRYAVCRLRPSQKLPVSISELPDKSTPGAIRGRKTRGLTRAVR